MFVHAYSRSQHTFLPLHQASILVEALIPSVCTILRENLKSCRNKVSTHIAFMRSLSHHRGRAFSAYGRLPVNLRSSSEALWRHRCFISKAAPPHPALATRPENFFPLCTLSLPFSLILRNSSRCVLSIMHLSLISDTRDIHRCSTRFFPHAPGKPLSLFCTERQPLGFLSASGSTAVALGAVHRLLVTRLV